MATSKKQKMLRASEEQQERWEAAAQDQGDSFNSWACDALDAAAEFTEGSPVREDRDTRGQGFRKRVEQKAAPVSRSAGCPAYHVRGVKCKLCGKTG